MHAKIFYAVQGTVRGKILEWEKVGEFGKQNTICQFLSTNYFLYMQFIHQYFTPPKVSRVLYSIVQKSRRAVVSREAKKKRHARAYSSQCDHYSELFTRMVGLNF